MQTFCYHGKMSLKYVIIEHTVRLLPAQLQQGTADALIISGLSLK